MIEQARERFDLYASPAGRRQRLWLGRDAERARARAGDRATRGRVRSPQGRAFARAHGHEGDVYVCRGVIFFWTGVLFAVSYWAAVRIVARIGLIDTMVFSHLLANVCLVLAPFVLDDEMG